MTIEEIVVGETYYTPGMIHLPVAVKVLEIKNGWVVTNKAWILPSNLYKTESDCPQR